MRIEPAHGVIEVGNIMLSRALQRTTAATEAMYLMASHVFDQPRLPPLRVEVQRLQPAQPPRRLAVWIYVRGIFRQHMVVKGRSRDSAWFRCLTLNGPQGNEPSSPGSPPPISTPTAPSARLSRILFSLASVPQASTISRKENAAHFQAAFSLFQRQGSVAIPWTQFLIP